MAGNNGEGSDYGFIDPLFISHEGHDEAIFNEDYRRNLFDTRFRHQLAPPSEATVKQAERQLNTHFGAELRDLLLTYGRLVLAGFETIGLSDKYMMDSPLVRHTEMWRMHSRKLEHQIVIYEANDNFIYCCNARDRVFCYSSWGDTLTPLYLPLMAFIVEAALNSADMLTRLLEREE